MRRRLRADHRRADRAASNIRALTNRYADSPRRGAWCSPAVLLPDVPGGWSPGPLQDASPPSRGPSSTLVSSPKGWPNCERVKSAPPSGTRSARCAPPASCLDASAARLSLLPPWRRIMLTGITLSPPLSMWCASQPGNGHRGRRPPSSSTIRGLPRAGCCRRPGRRAIQSIRWQSG